VFIRGLKAKMAINLAVLLLLAMVLIDLVTIVTIKRELIRSEIYKASLLLKSIEHSLLSGALQYRGRSMLSPGSIMGKILGYPQLAAVMILDNRGEQILLHQTPDAAADGLHQITKWSISSGKQKTHVSGTIRGLFFKHKSRLTMSTPLVKNGEIIGGICIVQRVESVFQALRNSQRIFLIYLFINLVILTFIGIFRISKLYLLPLGRLAKRAEDYKEDDDLMFAVRKEDNELNRLSKSLNIMLKRISADKKKLRSTVLSLEDANLELKKAQKEIIRAEKLASVGRLSAGIAHEIGNPIGIVIGYLELLKQDDITETEKIEYIQRTEEEIERINTIIRQLFEVSRPSNSGRTAVAVHELIHDMADVLRVQPFVSNIEMSFNLAAEKDTVWADSNQLRQVFLNLIINAADAINSEGNDGGGTLTINTGLKKHTDSVARPSCSYLEISFSDDGPGIPQDSLANIFDPFYTTKDPGKGTGLGLSVSFMIVESLGGKMTGVSEEGRGTTMSISLPVYKGKIEE